MLRGFLLCCLVAPAGADTVFLSNGTAIDGVIKARHESTLELRIGKLGRLYVPLDQIESIEKNDRDGSLADTKVEIAGAVTDVEEVAESKREAAVDIEVERKGEESGKKGPSDAAKKTGKYLTKFDVPPELRKQIERHMYDFTRQRSKFRIRAKKRLIKVGEPAVPFLMDTVNHQNYQVRIATMELFKKFGNETVIPAVLERLDDDNEFVREEAVGALRKLTGKEFGFKADARREQRAAAVAAWREWYASTQEPPEEEGEGEDDADKGSTPPEKPEADDSDA